MQKCWAVYRAERFSPNSVERDKAIMDAVCERLSGAYNIYKVREEELESGFMPDAGAADICLTMARSAPALHTIAGMERRGVCTLNSTAALRRSSRAAIDGMMRSNGIPCAPLQSTGGWWIKRGDEAAQEKGDVVFAAGDRQKEQAIEAFRERGISDIVVTAHVQGDLVKFYGVSGTGFFHTTYPNDGTYSKFGDEGHNGKPRHTAFDHTALHTCATRLAQLTGIEVYGGDCIVRNDGTFAIIDFNDWPSFSVCRDAAAEAIAKRANDRAGELVRRRNNI